MTLRHASMHLGPVVVVNAEMARWCALAMQPGLEALQADGNHVPDDVLALPGMFAECARSLDVDADDGWPPSDLEYITVHEAAARAQVTEQAVRKWLRDRTVGGFAYYGRQLVNGHDLDVVIERRLRRRNLAQHGTTDPDTDTG